MTDAEKAERMRDLAKRYSVLQTAGCLNLYAFTKRIARELECTDKEATEEYLVPIEELSKTL